MNIWQQEYQAKLVSVQDVLDSLKDGDVIGTSQCANEPTAIFDQMHTMHNTGRHFKIFAPMCFRTHEFMSNPIYRETFDMDITFLMGPTRAASAKGLFNYYPGDLHNGAGRWIQANGCNVFIAACTEMDKHGYFQIPLCLIHERAFLEAADRVILEVNPNLPHVFGDTAVHIRAVDMVVEAATPVPILPRSTPSERDQVIGQYVASLIHDGDCIQLGIGGIPDAAAMALMDKHDLGVHSEMLTNSMVDLVEAGAITGKRKTYYNGQMVGTFAYGDERLYDMLDYNPAVALLRGETVNNPAIVAKNDNFVSVNSCLAVDLTGQVCSESIGPRQYSGSGGQMDMAYGAAHSKGGRNIIAVASTKKGGTISSINVSLDAGSVVTLGRNELDYVVTEYGIAQIRGKSVRQRVENLIAIAHPDFRAELRKQANTLFNLF